MTSINTNTAAMTALSTLQQTNAMMDETQARVSTGLRIRTAADDAAYWSISATMKSDNGALATVKNALGLGAAQVDVAYNAMDASTALVSEIKNKLVAARQDGVDKATVQKDISQLQEQLKSIANSASFSGSNMLVLDGTARTTAGAFGAQSQEIVASFTRGANGDVTIGKIEITTTDFVLIDAQEDKDGKTFGLLDKQTNGGTADASNSGKAVLDFTIGAATTTAEMDVLIDEISQAETKMIEASSTLGSARNRISIQQDFVSSLMQSIDRGVGQLVDADMTEESSKLKALQVQQQLGIQSLSIANSGAQNILALFR